MITDTKNILALASQHLARGDVLYWEVINQSVARRCASRLTATSRYSEIMKGMQFSCRIVLAVETANKTQLLLRIERIA